MAGRPGMIHRFKPTEEHRKQVEAMASCGISVEMIARVLDISPTTLKVHFRNELDTAHVKANCAVAESLFQKAIGTGHQSVAAAIFWLKTRAGWSEYAAAPVTPPLGKKAQAQIDAVAGAKGTEWGTLVQH